MALCSRPWGWLEMNSHKQRSRCLSQLCLPSSFMSDEGDVDLSFTTSQARCAKSGSCEGEKSLQPLHFVQQPKSLQFLMGLVSRAMFWWQIDKLGSFSAGFVLTLRSSYSRHIFWVWGFDEVHCYLCSYGNIYASHVETTYWGSAWATPAVLNMWTWKLKLDEEKSNHAGLAQQIGFGPAVLHGLLNLVEGTAKPNTCQRSV
jgi:hypothetical protein